MAAKKMKVLSCLVVIAVLMNLVMVAFAEPTSTNTPYSIEGDKDIKGRQQLIEAIEELKQASLDSIDCNAKQVADSYALLAVAAELTPWWRELARLAFDTICGVVGAVISVEEFLTPEGANKALEDASTCQQIFKGVKDSKDILGDVATSQGLVGLYRNADSYKLSFEAINNVEEVARQEYKVSEDFNRAANAALLKLWLPSTQYGLLIPLKSGTPLKEGGRSSVTRWVNGIKEAREEVKKSFDDVVTQIPDPLPADYPLDETITYLNNLKRQIRGGGSRVVKFKVVEDDKEIERHITLGMVHDGREVTSELYDAWMQDLDVQYTSTVHKTGETLMHVTTYGVPATGVTKKVMKGVSDLYGVIDIMHLPSDLVNLIDKPIHPLDALQSHVVKMNNDLVHETSNLWALSNGTLKYLQYTREPEATLEPLPPDHTSQPQDHSLVRCSDDTEQKVYWLQNGKLYWITDWNVINDMSSLLGWSTDNIFPSDVFNPDNYPKGPRFISTNSESNGLLIKKADDPAYYFVNDGKLNPFSTWDAFTQRKYNPADVMVVTDAIFNRLSTGTWIGIEPFTIDLFLNRDTFTTGETKQTKVTQTSGSFYTVKTYCQMTKPDGTKRYAYYPNPNFQPTDPLLFSDTKRPLYDGTWISELNTWHFDTYTFTGNEPEGLWSWELWYENANNPGVKIASDTVTYTFTRSSQQEQNTDLNCDGKVDSSDSGILMSYWGTDGSGATSCRSPDINQDGIVDSLDLSILKSQWTQPNETPVARITMTSGSETAHEDDVLELTVPSEETANIHFSASRSTDPDGTISSYQWLINGQPAGDTCDFDSDNLNEGTYDIFLTVIDNERAEDSVGATIIIAATNNPPQGPPSQGLSADLNCDGKVDSSDTGILMSYWGTDGSVATSCRSPDINQDGIVDSIDLNILKSQWTQPNETPVAQITMSSDSETAHEDDVLELTVPSGETANVHFSASRSSDPDGTISSYQWLINGQPAGDKCDFDSNLPEGTYDIFLTVTDNEGAEDSVGASIIITSGITAENDPPTARINMTSGSENACEDEVLELTVPSGGTANVDFSASRSSDSDGSITGYQWLINGQSTSNLGDFNSNLGVGTHQIYLTVTDNDGAEGSVGASIIITPTAENVPPTAGLSMSSGSETAYEDEVLELTVPAGGTATVHFSADRSTDPDGSISSYKWYISGSHVSSSRDFSYDLGEGTHQIYLTVTDNGGAEDSVGASIIIPAATENEPPTAGISMSSGSETAYEDEVLELSVPSGGTAKVDFSASRSSDSDGSITGYQWYISGSHVSSSRDFSYDLGVGTHQIYLTVTDNSGAEGSVGASIVITATAENEPPTAGLSMSSGSETAYEDEVLALTVPSGGTAEVDFSASRSTDSDGSISSYKWYISGSHVSSSRDFSYNLGEGTHQIYLTVTDNSGAEGSVGATVRITATNEPPTAGLSMSSGSETAYEDEVLALSVPSGGTAKVDFSASRSSDSDGSITGYKWYISGSHVSSSRDFSYDLGEGTHQIYLTVTDNKGAEGSVGASVRITATNNPPTAGLSMSSGSETAYEDEVLALTVPSGGTAEVDFSASRSTDSDGSISSYKWYISGSHVSSSRDFSYNLGEGTHQIYLTVTDNKGAEGSVGASIIITATAENEPPTAGLSMTSGSETAYEDKVLALSVPSGGTAEVDFSASRSSDSDGSITGYKWYISGSHVSSSRDFSYDLGEGAHQIYLTVTDNSGAEGSVGASIIITATAENEPPTAGLSMTSGSETAYEDEVLALSVPSGGTAEVDFSASRSSDSDGSITGYKWYISGSHVSSSRDFSYDLGEGTHQIYLTVTDNSGAEGSVGASIIITATAENEPPTARLSMSSGSETAYEDEVLELTVPSGGTARVDFSASRSSDSDGSITGYKWYISGSHVSSSRDFSYNLGEGTHQIYLTVTDNKGAEGSVGATVRITATNEPPTAGLSMSSGSETAYEDEVLELTVPSGGTARVDFSASRSTDPDGSISSYKWYISGSHVSSSRDSSYNLGDGTHDIYLTVTDNDGAEGSVGATVRITATNNPPTARITMTSGSKTAYENQVLELTVHSGGTANVDFSASRSTDSDGSISSYKWYISGTHVSSSRDFSYNLGEGTHQIFLTVTDNKGAEGSVGASVRITC